MICELKECTGCGACSAVCPHNCIQMQEDVIGHLRPVVDDSKCIQCGLCKNNCHVLNNVTRFKSKRVYACWALDKSMRKESTSGGIATVLGKKFLEEGAIVYGCALTEGRIQHIRVDRVDDLTKIQGSKYVESPLVTIFPQMKTDLFVGHKVIFFGTPCQCAAMSIAFKKYRQQLYLVDLVCTGVPPQKLLWEHLNGIKPESISFRDETGSRITVKSNKGSILYQKSRWSDLFLIGFQKHLFLRDSCYNCKYSALERVSDITLGDYWGLGEDFQKKYDIRDGVSELFVNTNKGEDALQSIEDIIFCEERPLQEAIKGNPRYYSPSCQHSNRELFLNQYPQKGFYRAAKKALIKDRWYCRLISIKQNATHFLKNKK